MSSWPQKLDKVGVAGSVLAGLCCLGFPAMLSMVSAVGLGFLINDAILLPLLIGFLLITLVGLTAGMRRHQKRSALIVGTISAAALVVFLFVSFNSILAWVSIVGLVAGGIRAGHQGHQGHV